MTIHLETMDAYHARKEGDMPIMAKWNAKAEALIRLITSDFESPVPALRVEWLAKELQSIYLEGASAAIAQQVRP